MTDPTITRSDPKGRRIGYTPPLQILLVMAEPTDVPAFGGEALAAAVESALAPLILRNQVRIARAKPATERGIEDMLRAEPWHIIHFIGQGSSRPAAHYGTLSLQGSDDRARSINAQNFARLAVKSSTLGLVLFQSVAQRSPQDFEVVTQALLDSGLPAAAWLPDFSSARASADFARAFYGSLARGERLDVAIDCARRALASGDSRQGQVDTVSQLGQVLFASEDALMAPAAAHPQQAQPAAPMIENATAVSAAAAEQLAIERKRNLKLALERKRAAGEFDVFLCHNVADKPAVKEIGLQLRELAILPWLDEWELRPGMPWQRLLEEQMGNIRSAVVFVGREGIGPWQRQELDGFLREFAQRNCPVIPVLLPGAPVEPRLPRFLEGMTWVDFRVQDPEPMARLIWGITGQAPAID